MADDKETNPNQLFRNPGYSDQNQGYSLTGRIMLSAIIILFAVVVFMICLHLYARWYLLRARRRHLRGRNRRRTHLVFYSEPNTPNAAAAASRGLDTYVLGSLPVFVYSSATYPDDTPECAVCLSNFEENEKGRLLPKCNHSFHINCIDMWFHSHSTCPLCRSPVEPLPENPSNVLVSVVKPAGTEPGSSSGLCATCQHDERVSMAPSSSLGDRRKATVTIEVPRRNESDCELEPSSPASQGFKSPASRLLSLKRILSMNRKGPTVSPSSGVGTSYTELDIECGRDESAQVQTRVQTPR